MNRRMIVYLLGRVLFIEGALMLLPMICSLIYQERCGLWFLAGLAPEFSRNRKEQNTGKEAAAK